MCQVPHSENSNAYALARLASAYETDLLRSIPVEVPTEPSIDQVEGMDMQPSAPT